MKILVYSWRDPKHPLAGGAEQVVHEHMKAWINAGHTVTLFSSYTNGLPRKEKIDGVNIVRSGYQYLGVQLAGFFHYLKNKDKYDFVVDQFHGIPFFTPLYSIKPKLAILQEVAREVWLKNPLPKPINWIVGYIGYFGEFFVYQIYRIFGVHFMVGSESAKQDLEKIGIDSKNISIVHHGVKLIKLTKIPKKERTKTICFLGVLSKDKGIEDALKTFSLLSEKGHYQFWVIGRPETEEYFNRLKKLIKNYKIKIKFWGFVSNQKKFELLARSHVMLNPSILEGWGLVNIEANAMGTPVVAYKSPGLVDSVKHNESGLLVNKNTPEELAKSINSLLKNNKLYKKLRKGSVEWSKKFDWKKSSKESLELIEELHSSDTH